MDNGTTSDDSSTAPDERGLAGSGRKKGSTINCAALRREVQKKTRDATYTQVTLAKKAGVSQATVWNLVNGHDITKGPAKKLAEALGLPLEGLDVRTSSTFAYCGSSRCPSVCVAVSGGEFYVAPRFRRLTQSTRENCPYCKSLMYRECPNCRARILEEALYCPECKEPYVSVPEDLENLPPRDLVRECLRRNRMNEYLCRHLGNEP
jgi:DNA-binding XRE family transcriptional regulator